MSYPQTLAAQAALDQARAEARSLGHDFVGTEHLLLALLHDTCSELALVLARLEVSSATIRRELTRRALPAAEQQLPRELPTTPRVAQAQLYAEQEARAFERPAVGAVHLFLGLLREKESVAADVLEGLGVTLAAARDAVGQACGSPYRGSGLLTEPALPPPVVPGVPRPGLPPTPSITLPAGARARAERLAEPVMELERGLWEQQVFFGAAAGAGAGVAAHSLFDLIPAPVGVWALFGVLVGAGVSATGRFVVGAWVWGLVGLCLGAGLSTNPVLTTGGGALGFLAGVYVGLNLTRWGRPMREK